MIARINVRQHDDSDKTCITNIVNNFLKLNCTYAADDNGTDDDNDDDVEVVVGERTANVNPLKHDACSLAFPFL